MPWELAFSQQLVLFVNGKKLIGCEQTLQIVASDVDPETTLLQYLRNKLCLRGTKLGCTEGGCGACTVMISKYNASSKAVEHCAINACLAPLCSLHGVAVTTVEGIGSTKTKLHDIQDRLAKSHGTQCGFCTPGFVMSMYALLRSNPQPTEQDMETAFQGNLCRCTGYRPILEGFRCFLKQPELNGSCAMGEKCCRQTGVACSKQQQQLQQEPCCNGVMENGAISNGSIDNNCFLPCDPSQEPIFPSELQLNSAEFDSTPLTFKSDRVTWYRPTQLTDLLQLKDKYPSAKLIIGNTEIGVETKFRNVIYPVLIAATHISELNSVEHTNVSIRFGASVTLTTVHNTLKQAVKQLDESDTRIFAAIVDLLNLFACPQVRNVAAIAGNVMTASPVSDLNPLLLAAQCLLTLSSHAGGQRQIMMDENFFTGYRQLPVKQTEVLLSIDIPRSSKNEYFAGYKQSPRRDDDIATVTAGMRVVFDDGQTTVKEISLCFGGMAARTVMATKTASHLIGRKWNDELMNVASGLLLEEMPLPAGCPGGVEAYRCSLTVSFFFKFYLTVRLRLEQLMPTLYADLLPANYRSACDIYERPPSSGVQLYEQVGEDQLQVDAVGRPLPHLSAQKHTTGEAVYIDDMPSFRDELHLSLVLSTKAHARLLNIDSADALSMPGVVDFVSYKDVPGSDVIEGEEMLASKEVTCQGQVIGAIVAETKELAQRAAKAVKVTYEELEHILTIDEAIAADSFLTPRSVIDKGDVTTALAAASHVIEGRLHVGGQEHFYLETQACIAVPKGEDGEMEVYSSTQAPSAVQAAVAESLGVDFNKVYCHVKRIGGGFGGKDTRCYLVAVPVAVAANKLNRPVRCMLDRDEDMVMTGTRHPMQGTYKVGFGSNGKIEAVDFEIDFNGGNTVDMSPLVLNRAMFNCDNCYFVPNVRIAGRVCKTNIPSNTAFRGFGCPQVFLLIENILNEVALFLNLDQVQVRRLNLYKDGDKTHYNQTLVDVTLDRCWTQLLTQADYEHRKQQVDKFNRENRWKKRGICVTPAKFGVGFTADYMNQAGALVHIYTDGSVLLSHGGVEMGQGLHTKMVQVASRVLKVPVSQIHLSETCSRDVPNSSATAASCGSDICGMAVMNACEILMERLKPYMEKSPSSPWKDWVMAAYLDRISLSASGFYSAPKHTYDAVTNSGNKYRYFTYGVGCSEVEIDCLTGGHKILRTDIVMDVGKSLNPAIDVGQIEGAFMQGCGLYTIEQQKYSPGGYLLTRGPSNYKIPSCASIPIEFNVTLLKDAPNFKAVYSSKGVGEPPLCLATSVFLAIKTAILAARKDAGLSGLFHLDSPATAERIRMACVDDITKQVPLYEKGTFAPWFINV